MYYTLLRLTLFLIHVHYEVAGKAISNSTFCLCFQIPISKLENVSRLVRVNVFIELSCLLCAS